MTFFFLQKKGEIVFFDFKGKGKVLWIREEKNKLFQKNACFEGR